MGFLRKLEESRLRRVPLTAAPVIFFILFVNYLWVFGLPKDQSLEALEVLAASFFGCIAFDLLRIIVHFAPLPGGRATKLAVLIVGAVVVTGCGIYSLHELNRITAENVTGKIDVRSIVPDKLTYECENSDTFTLQVMDSDHIQTTDASSTSVELVKETDQNGVLIFGNEQAAITFTAGYGAGVIKTDRSGLRSTICHSFGVPDTLLSNLSSEPPSVSTPHPNRTV